MSPYYQIKNTKFKDIVNTILQEFKESSNMRNEKWLQRGIEELDQNHWFDGYQMILGAYQRALQSDSPEDAVKIVSKTLPMLESQNRLACDLISVIILSISQNPAKRPWVELIPVSLREIIKSNLTECVQGICNKIIQNKMFQDSELLQHINNIILEKKYSLSILNHLYYCYIGILCRKKDFASAFESLSTWSSELEQPTPKIRTYLTLAEINAFEIKAGEDSKYLKVEDSEIKASGSSESETESYLEIANRIFRAVQVEDATEFKSTIQDYSDLINYKSDALLKVLCDGISEIFKPKANLGLSSLFGA